MVAHTPCTRVTDRWPRMIWGKERLSAGAAAAASRTLSSTAMPSRLAGPDAKFQTANANSRAGGHFLAMLACGLARGGAKWQPRASAAEIRALDPLVGQQSGADPAQRDGAVLQHVGAMR